MDPYTAQMVMLNQIGRLSGAFMDYLSGILIGLLLIIGGLLTAAIMEYLTILLCRIFKWEKFGSWSGLSGMIHKVRPDISLAVLTGQIVFWLVFVSFFMKALQKMKIIWLSNIGNYYYEYLPGALNGFVILLITILIARALGAFIMLVIDNKSGFLYAGIVRGMIITIGAYIALIAAGFDRQLITSMSVLLLAGLISGTVAMWWKRFEQGCFDIIRIPDVEEQ